MGEAACRGPRERHSPGPNLALNGPDNVARVYFIQFSSLRRDVIKSVKCCMKKECVKWLAERQQ